MTKRKSGYFPISMSGEKREEVAGYVIGAFGIRKMGTKAWGVTHIPSGLALSLLTRPTLKEVEAMVVELDKLPVNWCVDYPGLGKQPGDLLDWRDMSACVRAIALGKTAIEAVMEVV